MKIYTITEMDWDALETMTSVFATREAAEGFMKYLLNNYIEEAHVIELNDITQHISGDQWEAKLEEHEV